MKGATLNVVSSYGLGMSTRPDPSSLDRSGGLSGGSGGSQCARGPVARRRERRTGGTRAPAALRPAVSATRGNVSCPIYLTRWIGVIVEGSDDSTPVALEIS